MVTKKLQKIQGRRYFKQSTIFFTNLIITKHRMQLKNNNYEQRCFY